MALDDKPFAFRVSNVSRLTDITPNTFLMANASAIANGAHVENDELVYELHAADLQKCFASEVCFIPLHSGLCLLYIYIYMREWVTL